MTKMVPEKDHIVRMYSDYQIGIPKDICQRLGLEPGDFFLVEQDKFVIKLTPAIVVPKPETSF